jgi:hypothetical protein
LSSGRAYVPLVTVQHRDESGLLAAVKPRSYEAMIAESRERFLRDTTEHEMDVLHDDGLYRHLRFKQPGTSMYYFDLVTWPGFLSITGDCGSFLFSRTRDMFEFFGTGNGARGGFEDSRWGINPHYWSEKLQAPKPDAAQKYSDKVFRTHVLEWFKDVAEELEQDEADALRLALEEQVLAYELGWNDEHEAHRLLSEFEHEGQQISDSWEWDLREYDWTFLWCCWAIVWGVGQYNAAQPVARPRWRQRFARKSA